MSENKVEVVQTGRVQTLVLTSLDFPFTQTLQLQVPQQTGHSFFTSALS